jgi:hypothetical protein
MRKWVLDLGLLLRCQRHKEVVGGLYHFRNGLNLVGSDDRSRKHAKHCEAKLVVQFHEVPPIERR